MTGSRARRTLGLIWLCVLAALPPAAALAQPAGERLLNSAHTLLGRGLHEQAADEYRSSLPGLDNPRQVAEARYGLAIALNSLGEIDDTIDALDAIDASTDFAQRTDANALLASLLASRGDYVRAARACERVKDDTNHRLWPSVAAMHVELLHRAGDHRSAVDRFDSCREQLAALDSASHGRTAFFAGLSAQQLASSEADHARAAGMFAVAADSEAPAELRGRALLAGARSHRAAGDSSRVDASLRRAIDIGDGPTETSARLALGASLRVAGDAAGAIDVLEAIARSLLDAESMARAEYELGLAFIDAGDPRRASRLLDRVLESGASDLLPAAGYWRAKCDLRRSRFDEASERLARLAEQYPTSELAAESLYDLGYARQRAGDIDGALRALAMVRDRFAERSIAEQALMAETLLALGSGRHEAAIELAELFLTRYSDSERRADMRLMNAEARYASGDASRAADELRSLADSAIPVSRSALRSCSVSHSMRRVSRGMRSKPWTKWSLRRRTTRPLRRHGSPWPRFMPAMRRGPRCAGRRRDISARPASPRPTMHRPRCCWASPTRGSTRPRRRSTRSARSPSRG